MTRRRSAAAVLAIACATLEGAAQRREPGTLALVGGRVYASPDAGPIDSAVVIIESGRIAAVGPRGKLPVPSGTTTLDCTGRVVVAGFQNSHVHFTDPPRWADAARKPRSQLEADLREMLTRHGFTTVVDTASDLSNTRALRGRIESGEVNGPRILTAGSALYPPNGVPYYVRDVVAPEVVRILPQPANAMEAASVVRTQLGAGADIVKLFTGSWVERGRVVPMPLEIASAAVSEAHSRRKLVFAHPSNVAGLELAVRSGVDVLAHPIDDTRGLTRSHLQQLIARRVAVIPTLALFRGDADVLDQVRDFARLGGHVLFGTDVGYLPNFDAAEEYRLMASAGLGWREILASLTTAPARRFGEASERGRVGAGMAADLVVLGSDPRLDVTSFSHVQYTIRAGRLIYEADRPDPARIETELKEMQGRLGRALLNRRLDDYATMLAPEWRVTHTDGRVLTKAEVLDMVFGAPEPLFTQISQDNLEVRVLGEAAIVTGRTSFTMRDGTRIVLRFTDVVERRERSWLVVASHATAVSPEP